MHGTMNIKCEQHVRRMDRDRLPHLIMKYQPCGKWSQGRPLKRLLDCKWDRNRPRGQKPCKLIMTMTTKTTTIIIINIIIIIIIIIIKL